MIGIVFSDESEAKTFYKKVTTKIGTGVYSSISTSSAPDHGWQPDQSWV